MTNKTKKTADGGLFLSKKYPPQNKRAEITIKKTDTKINTKKRINSKKEPSKNERTAKINT